LKVAYFGLPRGAQLLLQDGHELDPCVLPPLSAPGRRRVGRHIATDRFFDARRVDPVVLSQALERALGRSQPELIVSWFWTRLLPGEWLRRARYGGIGVHPSLLPRHRGPNPYFWTIDSGDEQAGVTLHTLESEYDTGAILLQRAIPVAERNSWQLARALDRPSLALLREGVGRFARSRPPAPTAQDESTATWAPEPTGRELAVDWSWPTERVLRRIRALSPVPGLALEVSGLPFFVTRARATSDFVAALQPGEAAIVGTPGTLVIRTADGAIAIERAALGLEADNEPEEAGEAIPSDLDERALARAVKEIMKPKKS
jgi:methionyl-tRNA formyltransferase